jgi:hypothetical protein
MNSSITDKPTAEAPFALLFGEAPNEVVDVGRTVYDHDLQLQVIEGTREPVVQVVEADGVCVIPPSSRMRTGWWTPARQDGTGPKYDSSWD